MRFLLVNDPNLAGNLSGAVLEDDEAVEVFKVAQKYAESAGFEVELVSISSREEILSYLREEIETQKILRGKS